VPKKTWIARLADKLDEITQLLFPPLRHLAIEVFSLGGLIYGLVQLWKHL